LRWNAKIQSFRGTCCEKGGKKEKKPRRAAPERIASYFIAKKADWYAARVGYLGLTNVERTLTVSLRKKSPWNFKRSSQEDMN